MPQTSLTGYDSGGAKLLRVATPTTATDGANKAYVDILKPEGYRAPSGSYTLCNQFSSAAAACTSGLLSFVPIDLAAGGLSIQSYGVYLSTSGALGSGGSFTGNLGIYADDGTGGMPNTAAGPLYSGTVSLTATAGAATTVTQSAAIPQGRYWGAWLYVSSGTISTVPQIAFLSNPIPNFWVGPSNNWFGARGLIKTGQTALPTTDIRSTLLTTNTASQVATVGLRTA